MRLLFGLLFLDLLGFGIVVPLLPFMAERLGAGPKEVTFLIATYSAALLLVAPIWGRISDRIGRKPVLLVSFVGTASAFAIMGFADQLWMLFLARGLAGLLSGDIAASPAYVADITDPKSRAKSMGMLGAAFGLAFTIGPGIGATLAGSDPGPEIYRTIPLISAGLSLTTLVLAFFFLPESLTAERRRTGRQADGQRQSLFSVFRFRHMGMVVLVIFMISSAFAAMESTLALWAEAILGWGPREVGYLFVLAGVTAVICQGGLIGPLTRRLGEPRVVLLCGVLLTSGMASIALAEEVARLALGVVCLAAGFGLGNPALQSLVSRLSPAERTGSALGISQSTSSFARVCGPPAAGLLFEAKGPSAPYFAGTLVMLGVVLMAVVLMARLRDEPALSQP